MSGVWATLCVPLVGLFAWLSSCVGRIGLFPDPLDPLPLSFLTTPPPLPPFLPRTEGAPTGPMMKEEGLLSRRRFSTCGGTASLRPPHPDGRKLIRNASFGGYNELSPISLPGGWMMVWRWYFVDLHTGKCCWPITRPCSFTPWLTSISVVVDVKSEQTLVTHLKFCSDALLTVSSLHQSPLSNRKLTAFSWSIYCKLVWTPLICICSVLGFSEWIQARFGWGWLVWPTYFTALKFLQQKAHCSCLQRQRNLKEMYFSMHDHHEHSWQLSLTVGILYIYYNVIVSYKLK